MRLVLVLDSGEAHDVAEFSDVVRDEQILVSGEADDDGVWTHSMDAAELMRDVIVTVHQKLGIKP